MANPTASYTCTPKMIDLLDSEANTLTASPTKVTVVENRFEEVSEVPGARSQVTIRSNLEEGRDPSKLCNIPNILKIDRFEELRPAPHSVISYKISQFDSKIERVGPEGLQEFHYVDTSVDYVPYPPGESYIPPVVVKPKPPTRGMGPCNEFLDDIWLREVMKRQEYYKNRLPQFIKKRKKELAESKVGAHLQLMQLIGPDWFQELSPSQLNTIDNLKSNLVKDLKFNTVSNTIDSMTYLGIVPPPSARLVKKALKRSYNCPIEFLLMLYQFLDKNRTEYTLNDRLLLSSVVHLTMRETLKEMHIRIPSPPPPLPKPRRKSKKIPKPIKYKSPYLVPFTFQPEPRKHSGIYKNNHIQYPESPYFSYLSDLSVLEIFDTTIVENGKQSKDPKLLDIPQQYGVTDELEKEIIGELRLAQYLYNNMNDNPNVPLLRKPTIYIPCDYVMPVEPEPSVPEEEEPPVVDENQTNVTICVCVTVTTDFDDANKPLRKVCACDITCNEVEVAREDNEVEICNCQDEDQEEEEEEEEEDDTSRLTRKVCKCGFDRGMTCGDDDISICDCQDEEGEEEDVTDFGVMETQTQDIDCSTCVEVSETKKPVSCVCTEPKKWKLGERLVTVASRPSLECSCKEVVQKQVDSRLCQCDRCKIDRGELTSSGELPETDKSLMTGQDVNSGEEEDGSSSFGKPTCDCLEKYQEQVKMYEGVKKRMDVQTDLMSLQKQYIIGGVTYSRDGEPVYQLCGTLPKVPLVPFPKPNCPPPPPTGEPSHECRCMKVYKAYMEKHNPCLEAYKEYLRKIELDTKEYMDELAADKRYQCECNDGEEEGRNDEAELAELMIQHIEERLSSKDERRSSDLPGKSCICAPPPKPCCGPVDDIEMETELKLTLEINMDAEEQEDKEGEEEEDEEPWEEEPPFCVCDPRTDFGCVCGSSEDEDIICDCGAEVEEDLNIASSLKRFTLLEKIPCDYDEQLEIIKRALESLAADGFPLAKLPECHKLPHFKLWMQLRCGKFWTQEDRFPMLMESMAQWRHTDFCHRKVRIAKLDISTRECKKFTWRNAPRVKKMVWDKDALYYRKVRQAIIEDGREFFPSTFSYELPTYNFRDVYFSYVPGKEVECLAWKPWQMHEVKAQKAKN